MIFARKAAGEIKIICLKSFGVKKINEFVVINRELTNNFAGLVTGGLRPDVAHGPPVVLCSKRLSRWF
jgi:hypothetical protein